MLRSATGRSSSLELSQVRLEVCPACGCQEYATVGNQGKAFEVDLGNNIYRQPDYQIRRCLECDLYYKSNIIEGEGLDKYYQEVDFQKWESSSLFPTEKALLEVLLRLKPKSKILDYGCSTGRLLSRLVGQYECYGVELNQRAAEVAQGKGISILSGEELEQRGSRYFDAIVLSDVFEHLTEPTKVLARLCDSLNEKGMLVLCTGNADARACQKDIANFWYFRTHEHLCMLSRKHAEYLAQILDLKLVEWREVSHYDKDWSAIKQNVQNYAYWKFKERNNSFLSAMLRLIPIIKKAEYWEIPPHNIYTKDHVVLAFQK